MKRLWLIVLVTLAVLAMTWTAEHGHRRGPALARRVQQRRDRLAEIERVHRDGIEERWVNYQAAVNESLRAAGIGPVTPIRVLVYQDLDGGEVHTDDGRVIEVEPGDYVIQGPNGVEMVVVKEQFEKHGGLGPLVEEAW